MSNIIELKNVTKTYNVQIKHQSFLGRLKGVMKPAYEKVNAIHDINFEIKRGEILAYIGPNGAGKSTTLKLLMGLLRPTEGAVHVLGKDPFKNRRQLASKYGVLMGNKSQLWWDLPLIESFILIEKMYGVKDLEWRYYLIQLIGCDDFLYKPVRQLSLGQRMRGELIAAFLHKPEIVFLDEPTIGLDIFTKHKVNHFLLEINQQQHTTIIITTHDIQDVEKVCDKLVLISSGKLLYEGGVTEFIDSFDHYKCIQIKGETMNHIHLLPKKVELIERNLSYCEFIYKVGDFSDEEIVAFVSEIGNSYDLTFKQLDLSLVIRIKFKGNNHVSSM
ncbi:ATP-binding cassette domain-containing protein [Shouchella clausii]